MNTPGRRPALAFILVTVVINMLGVGLAWPILPKLVQHLSGGAVADAAWAYGFLATGFALAQFFAQPILGALSDRFGRRPVMIVALIGIGADYLIMALSPNLAWLAVARIVGGVFAATNATANAYVADITAPKDRSRAFGLIGAAFGVGFVLGPLLGGVLGAIDLRLPFILAAVLAGANALYGLAVLPESLPTDRRRAFSLARANPFSAFVGMARFAGLAPLMLALLFINTGQRGLEAIWVLFLDYRFGWGVRDASFSLAFVGVLFVLVQGVAVGPVTRRFGEWPVAIAGFALSAVSMAGYGLMAYPALIFPLIALQVSGVALAGPALSSLCSAKVPADEQGLLQGTLAAVNSLAVIIGPFSASMVLAAVTRPVPLIDLPGAWFFIAAILFAAGAMLIAIARRRETS